MIGPIGRMHDACAEFPPAGAKLLRRSSPFRPIGIVGSSIVAIALFATAVSAPAVAVPDPRGTQLWAARLDDPLHGPDGGNDVVVAPDGSFVYVTGYVEGTGGSDFKTVAFDAATGRPVWSRRFDTGGYDFANAISLSPDGTRLYVTGIVSTIEDIGTVAYDAASGEQLWSAIYDDPLHSFDLAFAMAASPDTVFVAGTTAQPGGTSPPTVIAYDATTGAQRWLGKLPIEGDFFAVGTSPDGTMVFATGECCQDDKDDYITAAYQAGTGLLAWQARYHGSGSGQDAALDLAVEPNGDKVFVTGFSNGQEPQYAYATVAYDAQFGSQLWASRYDGQEHLGGLGQAIAVSPDGGHVYVTGEELTSLSSYGTVAYDAETGSQVWASEFHAPGGYNIPSAIAAAPTGTAVYVTGDGATSNQTFYQTVAYDPATGARRWVAVYTGPDGQEDDAYAIAASPDGRRVFVTGRSYGPADSDFATIAYRGVKP